MFQSMLTWLCGFWTCVEAKTKGDMKVSKGREKEGNKEEGREEKEKVKEGKYNTKR